jgi:hypothetical protein
MVVLDEAQILGQNAIDDMIPATNQAPEPADLLHRHPAEAEGPVRGVRQPPAGGDLRRVEDTLYIEFSADEDADPKRPRAVGEGEPVLPAPHTSTRAMLRMKKNLGAASFLREGWASGTRRPRLVCSRPAPGRVAHRRGRESPDARRPDAAFGIAADLDQTWLSLGAVSDDEIPHLAATLRPASTPSGSTSSRRSSG